MSNRRTGIGVLVAAVVAIVASCVTLSSALEKSASIVNDPVIVTLVVNGVAIALIIAAAWALFRKRGLVGGFGAAVVWAAVIGIILSRGLDANAARLHQQWNDESAVYDLAKLCDGAKTMDARAHGFDPNGRHELVIASKSNGRTNVFAKQHLAIAQADLLACEDRIEDAVETCHYTDSARPGNLFSVSRIRVSSHVRFVAIKTGETVWETTVRGASPRACGEFESDRAILGDAPSVRGIYESHFSR